MAKPQKNQPLSQELASNPLFDKKLVGKGALNTKNADVFVPFAATRDKLLEELLSELDSDPRQKRQSTINALRRGSRDDALLDRELGILGGQSLSRLTQNRDVEKTKLQQLLGGIFSQGFDIVNAQRLAQANLINTQNKKIIRGLRNLGGISNTISNINSLSAASNSGKEATGTLNSGGGNSGLSSGLSSGF